MRTYVHVCSTTGDSDLKLSFFPHREVHKPTNYRVYLQNVFHHISLVLKQLTLSKECKKEWKQPYWNFGLLPGIIFLLELVLEWVFYYMRLISKRRDRQTIANSLCILALKVRQWWAQTPLAIAEAELGSLTSLWWSSTSFRAVNVASSIIFFSLWRHLIKLIQHVLWSKWHSFLTTNCDIKIPRCPENISNCFSEVAYIHWTNGLSKNFLFSK